MSYLKNDCWDIRFTDPVRFDPLPFDIDTNDIVLDDFYGEIRSGFNFFDFDAVDNSTICSQVTMLMSENDEQIFLMRNEQRSCAPVELESVELPGTCCDFSSFPSPLKPCLSCDPPIRFRTLSAIILCFVAGKLVDILEPKVMIGVETIGAFRLIVISGIFKTVDYCTKLTNFDDA